MAVDSSIQRITRLTPLSAILALIDSRVGAVTPQKSAAAVALRQHAGRGCGGVASVRRAPIALRDGFAVEAARDCRCRSLRAGAVAVDSRSGSMSASRCRAEPTRCCRSMRLTLRGDRAEAIAAVSPGEGVLPAGGDATPRTPLRRAGERMRAIDIAVMCGRRHRRGNDSSAAHPHRLAASNAKIAADRKRVRRACPCRDRRRMHGARGAA